MPDWIDGAHHLRVQRVLRSGALALLLCRCAVYDSGLVNRANATGAGGGANQTGTAGQGSSGGSDDVDGGSGGSNGGMGGAITGEAGGAAGSIAGNGGGAADGGTGGSTGTPTDLSIFRDGTFVPGWSTTGSWLTCNGTPTNATVSATTALAIDLSCNPYNGVLLINWSTPVPQCTYATLSFDIYFTALADITALNVYLQDSQGRVGLLLSVPSLVTAPVDKSFNHVSLPLTSFGTGVIFNGLGFFNSSAAGIPLFYLNNVVLGVGTGACADGGT